MFFKSKVMSDAGRVEEGPALVGEMMDRFGDSCLPLRRRVAHALRCTVMALRPNGAKAALVLCEEGRRRYADEPAACMQDRLLSLFVEESLILARLGRIEEGRALWDALAVRFEGVADEWIRDRLRRPAHKEAWSPARAIFHLIEHQALISRPTRG